MWWSCLGLHHTEVFVSHRNARLTVHGRRLLVERVACGRPVAHVAAEMGITRIERVLTDNAWAYRKGLAWKNVLAELGARGKLTRAYRPQTNSKVERFNRTLADEWAYQRPYTSNDERTAALADFLRTYNHHRCHTALGGQLPITRGNNAAGQYT
ncbi:integrase core domain-containing protein [Streptomyces sp. HUAS MG91]|uniref:Integrase core domain-containing protein n=1 Tax=Streptomyces tabacisoli TaxID=3156398 RepID=A0AAU8J401_9ACTN